MKENKIWVKIKELFGFHEYEVLTVTYNKEKGKIVSKDKHCKCKICGKRYIHHVNIVDDIFIYKVKYYDSKYQKYRYVYKVANNYVDAIDMAFDELVEDGELEDSSEAKSIMIAEEVTDIDGYEVNVDSVSYYKNKLPIRYF